MKKLVLAFMEIKLEQGFLFPQQYWLAEFCENLEDLQKECYLIRKNDKGGITRTNTGDLGYHSTNITDLDNLPNIKKLMDKISKCVNFIHKTSREGDLSLANFWVNISGKGSSNTVHTHAGITYSGVFYIRVPEGMKGGNFRFYRNFSDDCLNSEENMGYFKKDYKRQLHDYSVITLPPKENLLIVFPGWAPHAVEIISSDGERIGISFNFMLNKSFSK